MGSPLCSYCCLPSNLNLAPAPPTAVGGIPAEEHYRPTVARSTDLAAIGITQDQVKKFVSGDNGLSEYSSQGLEAQFSALFTKCNQGNIVCTGAAESQYIHKNAQVALERLFALYAEEQPSTMNMEILSALRSLAHQRRLCNDKVPKYNSIEGVFEFSAYPSASRHHWGADFDFVALSIGVFTDSDVDTWFRWMERAGPALGFCNTYTFFSGNGHSAEPWHWSYRPVAEAAFRLALQEGVGTQVGVSGDVSDDMVQHYFRTIDPSCATDVCDLCAAPSGWDYGARDDSSSNWCKCCLHNCAGDFAQRCASTFFTECSVGLNGVSSADIYGIAPVGVNPPLSDVGHLRQGCFNVPLSLVSGLATSGADMCSDAVTIAAPQFTFEAIPVAAEAGRAYVAEVYNAELRDALAPLQGRAVSLVVNMPRSKPASASESIEDSRRLENLIMGVLAVGGPVGGIVLSIDDVVTEWVPYVRDISPDTASKIGVLYSGSMSMWKSTFIADHISRFAAAVQAKELYGYFQSNVNVDDTQFTFSRAALMLAKSAGVERIWLVPQTTNLGTVAQASLRAIELVNNLQQQYATRIGTDGLTESEPFFSTGMGIALIVIMVLMVIAGGCVVVAALAVRFVGVDRLLSVVKRRHSTVPAGGRAMGMKRRGSVARRSRSSSRGHGSSIVHRRSASPPSQREEPTRSHVTSYATDSNASYPSKKYPVVTF